jgi:hypothetical protein
MAFLIFLQNFGVSIGIVISNVAFAQTLTKAVPKYAPSVTGQAALDAGSDAHAVRHLVVGHEDELNGVLMAYSESLRNVFYFLVAMAGLSIVLSLGMGWVDVRKKKEGAKMVETDDGVEEMVEGEKSVDV